MIEVMPERLLRVLVAVQRLVICKVGIKVSPSSKLARGKIGSSWPLLGVRDNYGTSQRSRLAYSLFVVKRRRAPVSEYS